jgi:hypothetical protein
LRAIVGTLSRHGDAARPSGSGVGNLVAGSRRWLLGVRRCQDFYSGPQCAQAGADAVPALSSQLVMEHCFRFNPAVGPPANLSLTTPRVTLLQVKLLHENTYQ